MGKLKERLSYIRGMADGAGLTDENKEGKIILELMSFLEKVVDAIDENADEIETIEDELEDIQEGMEMLESSLLFDEDDIEEDDYVEVKCENCGDTIYFDPEIINRGEELTCPSCQQPMVIHEDDEL